MALKISLLILLSQVQCIVYEPHVMCFSVFCLVLPSYYFMPTAVSTSTTTLYCSLIYSPPKQENTLYPLFFALQTWGGLAASTVSQDARRIPIPTHSTTVAGLTYCYCCYCCCCFCIVMDRCWGEQCQGTVEDEIDTTVPDTRYTSSAGK